MPHLTCSFPQCGRPCFVKKTKLGPLCNGHYKQYKKLLTSGFSFSICDLTPLRKYTQREQPLNGEKHCKGPGEGIDQICPRPCWGSHDYCQSHQRQIWDGIDIQMLTPIRHYDFQMRKTCNNRDCDDPAKARGKCARHYSQYRNRLRQERKEQERAQESIG